jgi:peptidyl-prolyl cis-trans isomerase B (cyclophilin B)
VTKTEKKLPLCPILLSGSVEVLASFVKIFYNKKRDNGHAKTSMRIGKEIKMSEKNPIVTIEMKNGDTMKLELYPDVAPNTVNNFISLVNKGFYDGLTFHRIIEGFMIQGGDPDGNGTGGPGYSIPGEFSINGVQNSLSHDPGVISMARSQHPDSAGSQFFIMHKKASHLDGSYAAFGKIIEGMDVVDKIATCGTDWSDAPLAPVVMQKVTVETFGEEYPEPETV